jgi:FdhD protein
VERPLTLFLNAQEIVTTMTIGDYPHYLAVGFLRNQGMLRDDDEITTIEYDEELNVVVVRTARETDYEDKLKKKTRTSGCAQGTVFGDLMENFEDTCMPQGSLHTSWLYALAKIINTTPSLYLEAGAIHGCVLAKEDKPLLYMEDVGRHNAVDKVAGYMFIPILVSRSGFTAWGVELARQANLTLIGRARGKRFVALAGEHRLIFDADPETVAEEPARVRRKSSQPQDAE